MVIVMYSGSVYQCEKAVKGDHDVYLYDENNELTAHISNIWNEEWDAFQIYGGSWINVEDEPGETEILQNEIASLRADLDYCLMLLE